MPNQHLPFQVFKFCPRCGCGKFTPDSSKSLSCADCGFQYFFNMVAAVAGLIYNEEGKLLMTVRACEPAKGELDLPGGFIDLGENAEQALQREIKEELNLQVVELTYYASFPNEYLYGGLTYHTIDLVYHCKVNGFESIKPADDVSSFSFLDLRHISQDGIGLISVRNILESLRNT